MWTPTTRAQHSRAGLRYGSDVTDAEWLILEPFLPALSWLLEAHRNGRIGSPIVAGSSNRSRSSSNVGSWAVTGGRPAPLRRILPLSEAGSRGSFRPRPIVLRATLVARAAAAMPPRPAVTASAAACKRRPRSSRDRRTASCRLRMGASSIIPKRYQTAPASRNPHKPLKPSRFAYFWGSPYFRFPLSLRMVDELLATRGIIVSHETVR